MFIKPNPDFKLIKETDFNEAILSVHQILSDHINKGHFQSFDKKELYYEYYLAQNATASIIILHGLSEFTKKYEEMTWYFLNLGYNVFIYDLRGHGYSYHQLEDLQMIHINKFDEYLQDTDAFINQIVTPKSQGLPLYIYAHSMGGAIATLYLQEYENHIDKLLLSSPLISPYIGMPHFAARILSRGAIRKYGSTYCLAPHKRFNPESKGSSNNYVSPSRFAHYMQLRMSDEHYQSTPMTIQWLYESLLIQKRILSSKKNKKIHIPVLIMNAEKDKTVINYYHKKLIKNIPNGKICTIANIDHALYSGTDEIMQEYTDHIFRFFSQSS